MKKTQIIELFKNIKKTKVSFLSIAFFVMLGTAAYLGIDWAVQGFLNTVDNTLESYEFQDIEIKYPYGLNDEYINDLSSKDAEFLIDGEYSSYQYFNLNNSFPLAKVTSLTNRVNVITSYDGNLPKTNKECAIERFYANSNGIKIGDTIKFIPDNEKTAYQLKAIINNDIESLKKGSTENEDKIAYLTNDTFLVTALVEAPEHLGKYKEQQDISTNESQVDVVIYVTKDAFNLDIMPGYTKVLLKKNSLRKYGSVTSEYVKKNEALIEQIEEYSASFINKKNNLVVGNKEEIRKTIFNEIANGEKTISNAKIEISKGEKELEEGKVQLENAKLELERARIELDKGWREYNSSLNEYNLSNTLFNAADTACSIVDKTIDLYRFIDENKENIDQQVQDLKDLYDITSLMIGYSLPETYYVVSELEEFFNEINTNPAYRENAGDYVEQYNLFIEELKSDPNFPSRDEVNSELDSAIESEVSEENKLKLIALKGKINEVYDDMEMFESLPSDLLMTFDLLKEYDLLDDLEGEIIDSINNELESRNIPPLKVILTEIDSYVDAGYDSYEDIREGVTKTFNYITPYIESLDLAIENEIKPLLEEIRLELNDAKIELENAFITLNKSEDDISNGWIEYNKGLRLFNDNQIKLNNAKDELIEAEKKILEGNDLYNKYIEATTDIKKYDATIIGRQSNYSIITSKFVADIIDKLKLTIGLLFVIVGVLVSYSAMSRLVYDQTKEIGTKKALGLKQKEITSSFILYSLFATIIGSILGIAFSYFIIEPVITFILADSFNIASFDYFFGLKSYILFTLFEMVVTLCAAYLATRNLLKRKAVKLLTGNEEIIGKKRFYENNTLWNKLSLLTKTIVNNIFNDRRRVFGTLIGIVGCASLLVCAMTFKTNMDKSILRQINDLSSYDTFITIDNQNGIAEEEISKKLDDLNIEHTGAFYKSGLLKSNNDEYVRAYIYTSNDDKLYDFVHQVSNKKEIKPTNGALMSASFCEYNGINVGDDITITDLRGNEHKFKVEGITENYLLSVDIFISNDTFEKEFNEEIRNNIIYARRNDKSIDELTNELCNYDGFKSVTDFESNTYNGMRAITSTGNIIFEIFLVLSVALAFLVILNLLVVFVEEKKKELIVLMINGYEKKYAKRYIYTDTILLTILGIIIGSIFGSIVGNIATSTFNTSTSLFMMKAFPVTFIVSALITFVLCFINALIALRRINKYRLVDINVR